MWVVVVAVVALVVIVIVAGWIGHRSLAVTTSGDPQEIVTVIRESFDSHWTPTNGPGVVNMRRKALREAGRNTVSVALDRVHAGSNHIVTVWMSQGPRVMSPADARVVKRIQERVLGAVAALPAAETHVDEPSDI